MQVGFHLNLMLKAVGPGLLVLLALGAALGQDNPGPGRPGLPAIPEHSQVWQAVGQIGRAHV